MKRIDILGIPVDGLTKTELLSLVDEWIISGQPHQIATVNAEFIVDAQSNTRFRSALGQADLNLADSTGIMWAARRLGQALPERISGADLVFDLAERAAKRHWRLYLVGGMPGIAQAAAATLKKRYPTLIIAGAEAGITPDSTDPEPVIKRINRAKPDILYVAFGAPKQELFIDTYKKRLGVPIMLGVGGSFDFIAGRVTRAPQWLRRVGFEWLWRLVQEPWRLKRIVKAVIIFPVSVIFRS